MTLSSKYYNFIPEIYIIFKYYNIIYNFYYDHQNNNWIKI